jgi:hypothetical protein
VRAPRDRGPGDSEIDGVADAIRAADGVIFCTLQRNPLRGVLR